MCVVGDFQSYLSISLEETFTMQQGELIPKKSGFSVRKAVSRNCTWSLLSGLPLPCCFCQSFLSVSLIPCDCHFVGKRPDPALVTLSSGTVRFGQYLTSPVIKIQAIFWDAIRC